MEELNGKPAFRVQIETSSRTISEEFDSLADMEAYIGNLDNEVWERLTRGPVYGFLAETNRRSINEEFRTWDDLRDYVTRLVAEDPRLFHGLRESVDETEFSRIERSEGPKVTARKARRDRALTQLRSRKPARSPATVTQR